MIVVQVFDQRHFKDVSQGFLGVVNILVSSFININTISTSNAHICGQVSSADP